MAKNYTGVVKHWALHFSLLLCISTIPSHALASNIFNYKGRDAGILVVSITSGEGARPYTHDFIFRRIADQKKDFLRYWAGNSIAKHGDFETDLPNQPSATEKALSFLGGLDNTSLWPNSEGGKVMVESLAPGKYELLEIKETYNNSVFEGFQTIPASIPFEIKSGSVLYLGEFKAIGTTMRNFLGASRPTGVRYLISDQSARDLPIAQHKVQLPDNVVIDVPVGGGLEPSAATR